tara:strand:- start:36 stop:275 length:240 start_codon:yes stop_codon:yes gene_type:complete
MIWDGDMSGSLLSLKEAAQALFGESNRAASARVRRLLEKQKLKTIKDGGKIYVSRDVLQRAFGIDYEGEVIPLQLKDRG